MCACSGEKERKGTCKKRNIVYETFCVACGLKEDIENRGEEKEENKEREKIKEEKKRKGEYK